MQYLHQAAIYVCTPAGRVARTIQGVEFDSDVLGDSLIDASAGKISSGLFGIALSCGMVHFDPATGKYTWAAMAIMRVTGILTVLILGTVIGTMIYRESHKKPTCSADRQAVMTALLPTFLAQASFWLEPAASTSAQEHDRVFYTVLYVTSFFFALVVGLMLTFIVLYRRRKGVAAGAGPDAQHAGSEIVWTGIPLIVVIVLFVMGLRAFLDFDTLPSERRSDRRGSPAVGLHVHLSQRRRRASGCTSRSTAR